MRILLLTNLRLTFSVKTTLQLFFVEGNNVTTYEC